MWVCMTTIAFVLTVGTAAPIMLCAHLPLDSGWALNSVSTSPLIG